MSKTATPKERMMQLGPLLFVFIALFCLSLLVILFSTTTFKDSMTFSLGLMLYCFVPGYCILMNTSFDTYQKLAFAVPLSIALVTLTVYFLNVLFFIPINTWSVLFSGIAYSLGGFFWPEIRERTVSLIRRARGKEKKG